MSGLGRARVRVLGLSRVNVRVRFNVRADVRVRFCPNTVFLLSFFFLLFSQPIILISQPIDDTK
jgi:hypothetical protein